MVIELPKIGVVVLNYNSSEQTLGCLKALRAARGGGERCVWVVDNGSEDGSSATVPPKLQGEEVWLPAGANLGYAGGNNAGIREALAWGADYVLVVNPDCHVDQDFLPVLIRALEGVPNAGMACPLVLDQNGGRIQSLGGSVSLWTGRARRRLFGRPAAVADALRWTEVDFPHGACMLLKRSFLEEAGLLNEAYFLYYEDVELGLRARREKWATLAIPQSRVRHADTTASGAASAVVSFYGTRNQAWVVAQYGGFLQRLSFLLLSCYVRWPAKFLSRLARGRFQAAWAVARGGWAGQFSRGWAESGAHLAVPTVGRRVKLEALP